MIPSVLVLKTDIFLQVAAKSTALAQAFSERYPSVHFIVQGEQHIHQRLDQAKAQPALSSLGSKNGDSRISSQTRAPGSPQTVAGAAAYILNFEACPTQARLREWVLAELEVHLAVLRGNDSVMFLMTPHLIPETGSTHPDVEAAARAHDLLLMQVANEKDIGVSELNDLVGSVKDEAGCLVIVNKFQFFDGRVAALVVKYQQK